MKKRVSAIDIGSNAIRMIVGELDDQSRQLKILKKWRAPVRLGKDVFASGSIGAETIHKACNAFQKFAKINERYYVKESRAIGTSALRESENKSLFIDQIRQSTGIHVEVIDGIEEARLVHLAVCRELDNLEKNLLMVDIGGGSVEVTFSENKNIVISQTFKMGTVRTLDLLRKKKLTEKHLNLILGDYSAVISDFFAKNLRKHQPKIAAGTGGNLECLGRLKVQLLKKTPNTYLTLTEINAIVDKLRHFTALQRMEKLGLKPDRADVILPAAMIIQMILRHADIDKILIPGVGLRDGILIDLLKK